MTKKRLSGVFLWEGIRERYGHRVGCGHGAEAVHASPPQTAWWRIIALIDSAWTRPRLSGDQRGFVWIMLACACNGEAVSVRVGCRSLPWENRPYPEKPFSRK